MLNLRSLRQTQTFLMGDGPAQDLVGKTASFEHRLDALDRRLANQETLTGERFNAVEGSVSRSLKGFSLVRYDAFDEGSGHQSFSIALVNDERSGIVISSLARRESVRIYAQTVSRGSGERQLSPEEQQAVNLASSAGVER